MGEEDGLSPAMTHAQKTCAWTPDAYQCFVHGRFSNIHVVGAGHHQNLLCVGLPGVGKKTMRGGDHDARRKQAASAGSILLGANGNLQVNDEGNESRGRRLAVSNSSVLPCRTKERPSGIVVPAAPVQHFVSASHPGTVCKH